MAKEEQQARQGGKYPYNAIPACLKLGKVVRDAGGEVPKAVIARELGMDEGGSAFAQLVASSKCYGIVEGLRTLKLTDAGNEFYFPTTDCGERTAMFSFLASPAAFRFLISKFDGSRVPDTSLLTNMLHRQQGVPMSWAARAAGFFLSAAAEAGALDNKGFLRYAAGLHSTGQQPAPSHREPVSAQPGPPASPEVDVADDQSPLDQPVQWTRFRSKSNLWTYNEAGGTLRLETPDPLPRALWDRLTKYVKMLEPSDQQGGGT